MGEPVIYDPTRTPGAQSTSARNEEKAKEHHVPEGELIYRAIRQDGDHALELTSVELTWAGIAAGLSMAFSFLAEGLLRAHLPDASWTPLITKLGYPVGFLIISLGRQQLFTEQTITAVLSLLAKDRAQGTFANVARLWMVVLIANLIGTGLVAVAAAWTTTFSPEVREALSHIGHAALSHDRGTTFVRAVFAGFLIATMVWMLPGSGSARVLVVFVITYIVGLGAFSHIIAGSTAAMYVVFTGERPLLEYLGGYLLPVFLGNSVGGVMFVALLAHAQHAPEESS